MYERFTDSARNVMQLANKEAQRFNHEYIGTEHMLLGLVEAGGAATQVLKRLHVDLPTVRREIERLIQCGPEMVMTGKLPMTPRAKSVIESAIDESAKLNHRHVGTEHMLLGMLREHESVAAQILMNLGLGLKRVRAEVLNVVGAAGECGLDRDDGAGHRGSPTPES